MFRTRKQRAIALSALAITLASGSSLAFGAAGWRRSVELRPTITFVNAATYSQQVVGAPGSSVSGFHNGDVPLVDEPASDLSCPLELAGRRLRVNAYDSAGLPIYACITFISRDQINFQVPTSLAPNAKYQFSVEGGGLGKWDAFGSFAVLDAAPGLFSQDSSGTGAASAYIVGLDEAGNRVFTNEYDGKRAKWPASADRVFLVLRGTGVAHSSQPLVVEADGVALFSAVVGGPATASSVVAGVEEIAVELTPEDAAMLAGHQDLRLWAGDPYAESAESLDSSGAAVGVAGPSPVASNTLTMEFASPGSATGWRPK